MNTEKGEGILDKFLEHKETNAHLTNRLTLYHSQLSSLDFYFLFHMKIYEFHMKKYHHSKYREEKDNSGM